MNETILSTVEQKFNSIVLYGANNLQNLAIDVFNHYVKDNMVKDKINEIICESFEFNLIGLQEIIYKLTTDNGKYNINAKKFIKLINKSKLYKVTHIFNNDKELLFNILLNYYDLNFKTFILAKCTLDLNDISFLITHHYKKMMNEISLKEISLKHENPFYIA